MTTLRTDLRIYPLDIPDGKYTLEIVAKEKRERDIRLGLAVRRPVVFRPPPVQPSPPVVTDRPAITASRKPRREYRASGPQVYRYLRAVSDASGFSVKDLASAAKYRDVLRARHVAVWLARRFSGQSLVTIGKGFGGRDHTTILHAVHLVEAAIAGAGVLVSPRATFHECLCAAFTAMDVRFREIDQGDVYQKKGTQS